MLCIGLCCGNFLTHIQWQILVKGDDLFLRVADVDIAQVQVLPETDQVIHSRDNGENALSVVSINVYGGHPI